MERQIAKLSLVTAFLACTASAQGIEGANLENVIADVKRRMSMGSEVYVMRTAFGDLTYDGQKDVAVLVRRNVPAGIHDQIWIFERRGRGYVFLYELSLEKARGYVLSIGSLGSNFAIDRGVLTFDQAVVTRTGCLPVEYRTVKYQWTGGGLIKTSASPLRPLPEHMREIG